MYTLHFNLSLVDFFFRFEGWKQPKHSLKDRKDTWKTKRWQKWDAIKHFICVIEFLWVIVLAILKARNTSNKNIAHFFLSLSFKSIQNENKTSSRPIKKCHAFYERKKAPTAHYFMCCHSAFLICIFIYFRLSFFLSFRAIAIAAVAVRRACLAFIVRGASNIFRVLFTSPLFISLSFLFNLSKLQKHENNRTKNRATCSKCRINFQFWSNRIFPF